MKTKGVEREKPSSDHEYLAEVLSKYAVSSAIDADRLERIIDQYSAEDVLGALRYMRYAPPGSIGLPFAYLADALEKGYWQ